MPDEELFRVETMVRRGGGEIVARPGDLIPKSEAVRLGLVDGDRRRIRTTRGA